MRKLEFYLKGSKSKKEGKELKGRKRKRKGRGRINQYIIMILYQHKFIYPLCLF